MSFLAFTEAEIVTKLRGMPVQKVAYNVQRVEAIDFDSCERLVGAIMDELFIDPGFRIMKTSNDPIHSILPLTIGSSTFVPIESCTNPEPRRRTKRLLRAGCEFFYKFVPDQGIAGYMTILWGEKNGKKWHSMYAFYISDDNMLVDMRSLFTWIDIISRFNNSDICTILDIEHNDLYFENLESRFFKVRDVVIPALAVILYTGCRTYNRIVVQTSLDYMCVHMKHRMEVPPFGPFMGKVAVVVENANKLDKRINATIKRKKRHL